MPNDKILELAKKLKALADRGVGGEQKNAVAKLHALLEKNGLTAQDLEDEKLSHEMFEYKNGEKVIFAHIIWRACGERVRLFGRKRKRNAFIIECTHAQKIEILAMQELYRRAYQKELKLFVKAFILQNDLGTDGEPGAPSPPMSLEERLKLANMMKGIDKQRAYKQLEKHG